MTCPNRGEGTLPADKRAMSPQIWIAGLLFWAPAAHGSALAVDKEAWAARYLPKRTATPLG